jgi:hypothetical protein
MYQASRILGIFYGTKACEDHQALGEVAAAFGLLVHVNVSLEKILT